MFFWDSLAFSMIPRMLAIWSLVPLPFLKPVWTSGSSWFPYCWSLAWRILSITLPECEMSAIVRYFEHSLALPFFGIGMKTDLSSPVATAEFSKFAYCLYFISFCSCLYYFLLSSRFRLNLLFFFQWVRVES